jgi:hypothetical protein
MAGVRLDLRRFHSIPPSSESEMTCRALPRERTGACESSRGALSCVIMIRGVGWDERFSSRFEGANHRRKGGLTEISDPITIPYIRRWEARERSMLSGCNALTD